MAKTGEQPALSDEDFSKYTSAISQVKDKHREDFIKYVVGGDPADAEKKVKTKYFDKVLKKNKLNRLDYDKSAFKYRLPGGSKISNEEKLVERKKDFIKDKKRKRKKKK